MKVSKSVKLLNRVHLTLRKSVQLKMNIFLLISKEKISQELLVLLSLFMIQKDPNSETV